MSTWYYSSSISCPLDEISPQAAAAPCGTVENPVGRTSRSAFLPRRTFEERSQIDRSRRAIFSMSRSGFLAAPPGNKKADQEVRPTKNDRPPHLFLTPVPHFHVRLSQDCLNFLAPPASLCWRTTPMSRSAHKLTALLPRFGGRRTPHWQACGHRRAAYLHPFVVKYSKRPALRGVNTMGE